MYQTIPINPQESPILPLSIEFREEKDERHEMCLKYGAASSTILILFFTLFIVFTMNSPPTPLTNNTEPPEVDISDAFPSDLFSYGTQSEEIMTAYFAAFMIQYKRQYNDDLERHFRYETFKNFLRTIDERNLAEYGVQGTATHGITKFADLTPTEFHDSYLGYQPNTEGSAFEKTVFVPPKSEKNMLKVDWTNRLTTGVKNDQSGCYSSYISGAVSQLESDAVRAGLLTVNDDLSAQQIASCDSASRECDSNSLNSVLHYVNHTGLQLSETYKYEDGKCNAKKDKIKVHLSSLHTLPTKDMENYIAEYLLSTGPLLVCGVDATTWSSYTGGILKSCGSADPNHCVQIVGVNVVGDRNSPDTYHYYTVRNSWGTDWGQSGYLHLQFGQNVCGIAKSDVLFTTASGSGGATTAGTATAVTRETRMRPPKVSVDGTAD